MKLKRPRAESETFLSGPFFYVIVMYTDYRTVAVFLCFLLLTIERVATIMTRSDL